MKLAVTLPNYKAFTTPAYILETAERAEQLGFHSLWVGDHLVLPESKHGPIGPIYEATTTLAVVAGRTNRIKLGFTVTPTPYRHPFLQAKSLATLDQLSNGRVIYGGATGYLQEEFEALGVDFKQRAAITDEYLQVLKLAWTADVIDFHGQYVDCSGMRCDPKPLQKPHPPIWLGGDSDGAFQRIVRYADGWHGLLGGSPGARREPPTIENFIQRVRRLREISEAAGRDPAGITLSLKAKCVLGPVDALDRPLCGPLAKVVDNIKLLERAGVELLVLSPNLGTEIAEFEVLDEIAATLMPQVQG